MRDLAGITVLVLGLGESGLAMARWCARAGAAVRAWDSREAPPQAATLAAAVPDAVRLHGALDASALDGVQRVLKSPGLAPHDAKIAALLQEATRRAIAVQGELDLFVRALADLKATCRYAPQVIAITGTNGKTTTTAMTALLVERSGRRVAAAGNIGPTMLATLADALEGEELPLPVQAAAGADDADTATEHAEAEAPALLAHLPEVWVLELSSFQLADARAFEPDAATVLNITQDHLDWHGTMADYTAAKARVFGTQAVMVINRDDRIVEALVPKPAPVPAKTAKTKRPSERRVVRFGLDAPKRPGDWGLVVDNDMAWLVRALESDETMRRGRGPGDDEEIHLQRLMPADALRVRGRHNAANALAALALASAIGCPLAPMLHGLREYAGEPHRVQFVASVDGVDAYDDSKGTNVGATVAALHGLGADRAPGRLVVILGGDGKGQDFGPLIEPVRRHVRAIATIGRDAAAIEAALAGAGVPIERHATLEDATAWSYAQARAGDAVLLSPACASLDMFRNYAHRAEAFVAAVQAHAAEHGGIAA
ncbi:MAG: UDP-N-acetylmuramoyl-L-alanine--D-glutamate ligase [Proteobacteria bacterium]|nr:UDP-N-acetylmuramoyl-L-alanine--D-glutamate ligase [Pseudomonadota bacterium]